MTTSPHAKTTSLAMSSGLFGLKPGERVLYHHLLPSSPWRLKKGVHSRLPQRLGLVALATPALPLVSPFTLDRGRLAFEQARAYARNMLTLPDHGLF
jgi:hypothetical protein